MNAPINSQEIRLLLTDVDAARSNAGVYADAHRGAQKYVLLGAARNALAWLKAWPARRAAMRELASLSDRELADIGLTRQGIQQVFTHR